MESDALVKPASLVVHGLGYVGLTAAVHFARSGVSVLGFDPDLKVVSRLNAGQPRAGEFLSYLDVDVQALVSSGLIRATNDFDKVLEHRTHLVAVPTERAGRPYDGIIDSVLDILMTRRFPVDILVESTLTPGTMDRFLERNTGVRWSRLGVDLFLAVCPRRDWFADPQKNLETLPRIVGGVTPACTQRAVEILSVVSPYILTTDYRTAELTKALENALLHVPVMFLHQLACALPGHNVAEAIRLASTHWRFASLGSLYLGFGTGGRCVPLGTEYLVRAERELAAATPQRWQGPLTIGEEALECDATFRQIVAWIVRDAGAKAALVLGVAYRPEFRDAGRSPGLDVARHLRKHGILVNVHDPMWDTGELLQMVELDKIGVERLAQESDLLPYDAILLATPHRQYLNLPSLYHLRKGQLVLDSQGAWDQYREPFKTLGVHYKRVGEPGWTNLVT